MKEAISNYYSGRTGFNKFFTDMRGLLSVMKEYDADVYEKIDSLLFDMEASYSVIKQKGEFDEESFRESYVDAAEKMKGIVESIIIAD